MENLRVVDFNSMDTENDIGNFKKGDNISTNIVSYTINSQKNNEILSSPYPGVVKTIMAHGSLHDIIAIYGPSDEYLGSIKLNKRLNSTMNTGLEIGQIAEFEEDIFNRNSNAYYILFLKLIMPLIDPAQPINLDAVSYINIVETLKPLLGIVEQNHDKGNTIRKYIENLLGKATDQFRENLDQVEPTEMVLMLTWFIEAVSGITLIDIVYEGANNTPLKKIINPTPYKEKDYYIRFWDLTAIQETSGLDFNYVL